MKVDITGMTTKEVINYLKKHKDEIIDMKKQALKHADIVELQANSTTEKTFFKSYLYENDTDNGVLKRTIVANTYNWMDSHDDVHLDNIFGKSIKERGKRIAHLHDHEFKLSAKVGQPITWSEKSITWKELGIDREGGTMALFLESAVKKSYNEQVYEAYLNDEIDQHSVGMRYVKIDLALNDSESKEEYAVWQAHIDKIGNKETVEKQGYFFAVKEAILIECSAVLIGSNELTPTLNNKFQPARTTEKQEPPKSTLNVDGLIKYYENLITKK